MTIMKIKGIQKSFNEKNVIKHADMDIKKNCRIGLVGSNGAGKTTLANLLHGTITPDAGTIETFNKDLTIGYLKQSTDFIFRQSLDEYPAGQDGIFLHASRLGLAKVTAWEADRFQHLSGGERLKLALAEIWSGRPDILILDEPTNHLDVQGLEWLITELDKFHGAALIISHDRHFLDQTVSEIIEIEDGKTRSFKGNYSDFRQEKEKLLKAQQHKYETQEKYKAKIEQQISTMKNWSEKAHSQSTKQEGYKEYYRVKAKKMDTQVKSKLKRLKNELAKSEVTEPKEEDKVSFQFSGGKKRGKQIMEAKNLGKSFGDHCLFSNSHFFMNHGERMGMIGGNGSGKTTLIRMLLGLESVTEGFLWKSESLEIGYLSQDVTDLPAEKTILDYIDFHSQEEIRRARTILANAGFTEEKLTAPISHLSLGERTRFKLVAVLLQEIDLLILDEPTNHLDLASRESLESILMDYQGSIIVVSHDVYFMNKVTEKLLVIEGRRIARKEFGAAQYYDHKTETASFQDKEKELMIVQNEINALIGKLSYLDRNDPEYTAVDQELSLLMIRKNTLIGK
ncbi:ribosomal protection-like ABC-F family protein [Bacillus sp. REN3]|uniref:ribosomal protection-like ABC-F family protein n=1 Tax=Bacillus sp. REN3 TaxID=2802440 RepID=UPI001AEDD001|nr:ABC-F type ribosomal protection protein [Bacillus sp. REN3]